MGLLLYVQVVATMAYRRCKVTTVYAGAVNRYGTHAYLGHLRTNTLNALLTCPLALTGTGREPVPSVVAPPRLDTRPCRWGMQGQVGWPAAVLERWQGLHEDLHVTTQVLARLVGQLPHWSGDWAAESGHGLADVPGKDLAGTSQTSSRRILLGTLSSGLHKDLYATTCVPLGFGLNVVDGVRALNHKGGAP